MADPRITDAEIAGYMGWRGPGAYTEASLRKIREIIDHVLRAERATSPSPNTAPACPTCKGNDQDAPCAYPSKGAPGCFRDARLSAPNTAPDATVQQSLMVAKVDDEGLPPLPVPWSLEPTNWSDTEHVAVFTAEQYRQGQRDAVAADRARMDWTEISDAITEAYNYAHSIKDWDAAKYWRELREQLDQWAAPSHTTNKENG